MGYTLRALVGRADALQPLAAAFPQAVLVALEQGLSLIPLTDDLYDALNELDQGETLPPFYYLKAHLEARILALIGTGCVGYLEAEYFGGHGEQAALLWADGRRQFVSDTSYGAINTMLRRLGVTKGGSQHDEFEAVGLDRHRDTDDWLPE